MSLDVWGSLWYDWHWGGLLFAGLLGMVFHGLYVLLLRGGKGLVRVVTLTYAGFVLGLATDVQVLMLSGFLTILLFLFLAELVSAAPIRETGDETADGPQ